MLKNILVEYFTSQNKAVHKCLPEGSVKETEYIKIITYNVQSLANKAVEVCEHLTEIDADIVFLQEICSNKPCNPGSIN